MRFGNKNEEEFNVPVEHLPHARELKTRLPYTESKLRVVIGEAVGASSACWENLAGAGVFESERAVQICNETIDKIIELTSLGEPNLGCATTGELAAELETRIRLGNGHPDYRTVNG